MKAVRMTTPKWKGLKVGQVVEFQGDPYVIVAMGMGNSIYRYGSLQIDLVLQGPSEIPNQDEETFSTSTIYMHGDDIHISVGEFGTMNDGLLIRVVGIKKLKWVMTDLAVNYIVQSVPGWPPVKINKIITDWYKANNSVPVIKEGSKVVKFDFKNHKEDK
ncbi:hypothetical protein LMB49_10785 [Limosilactobacillus reuteri]|uniref:hypothetical protein n=1 Tax=Limosilactobacillus reuteri TaxID=1598 RepID=UPI001E4C4419|nr:hypothetical protein [Limosilactobacillus reuteri]MCC4370554.1 hypothetical protein [Limosilactobacillus reuteri]MCC4371877.1 hypothetical protein [Limosilactobacillus reuteri]MCC4509348.1 hypothetical protein [Limosilactobacillus reuteri]MCC4509391.1 hypothetical protein [Limosilactobacillus reuteri]